jgi:hypothetical protein
VRTIGGATLVVAGDAGAGRTDRTIVDVRLYAEGDPKPKKLWLATVSADGRYKLVAVPPVGPGRYTVRTSQSYRAGTGVRRSPYVPFALKAAPPGAADTTGQLTVSSPTRGAAVSDQAFRITGSDDPDPVAGLGYVKVIAYAGTDLTKPPVWQASTVRRAADGRWSTAFDASLPSGPYTLFVKETDAHGLATGLARKRSFTWSG